MRQSKGLRRIAPVVEPLEPRETPTRSTLVAESFDQTAVGSLPTGWSQWNNANTPFAVSAKGVDATRGLGNTSPSSVTAARAWYNTSLPADVQATASVYLDTLIPARIFVRGSGVDTATPSYYALSVTRGLEAQLLLVQNGTSTVLATIRAAGYFSGNWVQATLDANGANLRVQIYRPDTGQYLSAGGQWQSGQAWALSLTDSTLSGPGMVGIDRGARYAGAVTFDDFTVTADELATFDGITDTFDDETVGLPPTGWLGMDGSTASFQVSNTRSLSTANGVLSTSTSSNALGRMWLDAGIPADVQATAAVFLDSLIPGRIFVRGVNVNTSSPSYYAVSLTRGLEAQLLLVQDGAVTVLGKIRSALYFSGNWVRATLYANGTNLRVQLYRPDTAQYLNASGQWQSGQAWALNLTDTGLAGPGAVGIERPSLYAGAISFDDFGVFPAAGDNVPPTPTITSPGDGATLTGVVTVQATATDNVGVAKLEFYVDGVLREAQIQGPYRWDFDTTTAANGRHLIEAVAYDAAGNAGRTSITVTTQNDTALPLPSIPRHYSHIRISELAYSGTPFSSFEDRLLRDSIDLVIPAPMYLDRIAAVAPDTPQMVYSNLSNLYWDLLTDWLQWADANGVSRESAFFHTVTNQPWSGDSASSQPVNWFWNVRRSGAVWTDFTSAARGKATGGVVFGNTLDSAMYLGYPERFREINVNLSTGAANGWAGVIEYASAVDAAGNPTQWKTLPLLGDGTAGLTRSGTLLFDPPADWKPAALADGTRFYYVRIRTTKTGTAPVATTILGRDYVGANGTTKGVIPGFDASADKDGDGYLNDAEYAKRAAGKDARFLYESRVFYLNYGQMRFATNPSSLAFRNWAVDYQVRYLRDHLTAAGVFLDNSGGNVPVVASEVVEPVGSYSSDYGTMINAIARAIAPDWVLTNTSGGGSSADAVIQRGQAYFEEFAIRPLVSNYVQFEDLAATIARRATLRSPSSYAILDSLPTGGSPTDPRTQMATLAYYYLLADPDTTFLDLYGGFEPASSWTRHWFEAIARDVGQPVGTWSLFATGKDPSNSALTYRVYQREYGNALVLYKPLSYANGVNGSLADATATTHVLNGTYYVLNADNTLGPAVTSVTLRNGEGVILVKKP